jgi:hypothetical protein
MAIRHFNFYDAAVPVRCGRPTGQFAAMVRDQLWSLPDQKTPAISVSLGRVSERRTRRLLGPRLLIELCGSKQSISPIGFG